MRMTESAHHSGGWSDYLFGFCRGLPEGWIIEICDAVEGVRILWIPHLVGRREDSGVDAGEVEAVVDILLQC